MPLIILDDTNCKRKINSYTVRYHTFTKDKPTLVRDKEFARKLLDMHSFLRLNSNKKNVNLSYTRYKPVVLLLVYKRIYNLEKIIRSLEEQSYKKFYFKVVNNDYRNKDKVDSLLKDSSLEYTVSHNKENKGSWSKFTSIKNSKGNPVLFLDDDMIPKRDFVEYNLKQYNKYGNHNILGWYGFAFKGKNYWTDREKVKYGQKMDYVGSGSMVCDRKVFDIEEIYNIPNKYKKIEDLWFSYVVDKKRYSKIKISKRVKHIKDKNDQFRNIMSLKKRMLRYLLDKGWILLKDKETYDFIVCIPTKDRVNMCYNLLRKINQEKKDFKIKVIVFNDGSTSNYNKVKKYTEEQGWDYIFNDNNNGKKEFYKTINKMWGVAKKYGFKNLIHLSDDFDICLNFFDKVYRMENVSAKNEALNLWVDNRVDAKIDQWGCKAGKVLSSGLFQINWCDGISAFNPNVMNQLNWKVNPVNKNRWNKNKNLSSGVWSQVSTRLYKAGCKILSPPESLVCHLGNNESMMNDNERKKNPLKTIGFENQNKITVIKNKSSSNHFVKLFMKSDVVNLKIEKNHKPLLEDIYFHSYLNNSFFRKAPKNMKKVLHFLGSDILRYDGGNLTVDGILYPSQTYKKLAENKNPKLKKVPNEIVYIPISKDFEMKKKKYGKKLLYIGRLLPKKGVIRAINIAIKLRGEYSLDIVGEEHGNHANYYRQIKRKIRNKPYINLRKCVKHNEINSLMANYDYILSTSSNESVHAVAIEGIVTGLCPVIFNWKGSDEVYPNIEKAVNIDGAIKIIRSFDKDINRTKKLSKEYKERFAEEKYIKKFELMCKKVLSL